MGDQDASIPPINHDAAEIECRGTLWVGGVN